MRPPKEKWQHVANLAEVIKILASGRTTLSPAERESMMKACDDAIEHIQSSEECEED